MAETRRVRIDSLVLHGVPHGNRGAVLQQIKGAVTAAASASQLTGPALSGAITRAIAASLTPRTRGGGK